ncbi:hypothetical protein BGX21_000625 [Mortierella sp. AD011]|nr:hypothetical protein BGX20_004827 [Mortierella sp. AD010]KAF9401776.1 hypothetical protein BGX21_000625 [Mortierella sp. AD011]
MTDSHQPSKLTALTIRRLTLTRGSLTSILQCCPALETIDLWETTLIPSWNFDDYQHARVNRLTALITDTFDDGNPPLLVHFPELTWLDTYYDSSLSAFPTQKVKDTVSRWCPNLNYLGTNHTPALILSHLVANVLFGLSGLVFNYDNISPEVILALLCYPDNWITLSVYSLRDYYSHSVDDPVPMVKDHFQGSRWMIQSIMRGYSKLRLFHFPDHEMDMDQIDRVSWSCNELKSIRVRIKGLDTKERIEGAINRWKEGKKQKSLGKEIKNPEEEDDSIEARVARHLLQFDKLRILWLGTKTCAL